MSTDERNNLPSASSAHRYATCPGSFLLEQQVPPGPPSPDAEFGNIVHALLSEETVFNATDDHRELADRCRAQEAELVTEHGFTSAVTFETREKRFWSTEYEDCPTWSGKPDVVYNAASGPDSVRVLLIDYKTGRGEVDAAEANLQLRALVVLVAEHYGNVIEAVAAVIQPLAGKPTVCRYSAEDIMRAAFELQDLMEAVKLPDQPLNPSPAACKYCRAKPICPAALDAVETLPALAPRSGREIAMTPEQIAAFLDAAKVAEDVIESVREKAKRLLEADYTAVPGWRLKPGVVRETITRPDTVFARFVRSGGTQEQFMGAVSIGKTKLKDALRAATGTNGKTLDALLADTIAGCIEEKTTSPSLAKGGAE